MNVFSLLSNKTRKHLRSYKAAFNGLNIAFNHELNFQIELLFMAIVILMGFVFNVNKSEWIVIILCIGITLSAELMNTSIEVLGELKRFNSVIKKIKDLAAAAVFVAAVMDVILGCIIFTPYVVELFL